MVVLRRALITMMTMTMMMITVAEVMVTQLMVRVLLMMVVVMLLLLLLLWSVGWDGGGGVRNCHGGQSSLKSNARTLMEMDESGMVTQLHGDRYITCGGFVCGCARNCQVQGACTRRRARQRYRKKQKMTSRIQ